VSRKAKLTDVGLILVRNVVPSSKIGPTAHQTRHKQKEEEKRRGQIIHKRDETSKARKIIY